MSTARPSRANQGVGDMLRSMAVVLAFVGAFSLLSLLNRPDVEDPVKTVDYTAQLQAARQTAPYDVLAPTPQPPGWRATSVYAEGDSQEFSWHIGFLTGDEQYVGLEQSNADPAEFLASKAADSTPDGRVDIAGTTWQRRIDPADGDRSLVRVAEGATTVVTGTVDYSVLAGFAASLR